jgi:hypothetical protein
MNAQKKLAFLRTDFVVTFHVIHGADCLVPTGASGDRAFVPDLPIKSQDFPLRGRMYPGFSGLNNIVLIMDICARAAENHVL